MGYLQPLELVEGELTDENEGAVKTAIEKIALKGLKHEDMALRHVGILSPPKHHRRGRTANPTEVVLFDFDLGRVSETDDHAAAEADMKLQLNLMYRSLKEVRDFMLHVGASGV